MFKTSISLFWITKECSTKTVGTLLLQLCVELKIKNEYKNNKSFGENHHLNLGICMFYHQELITEYTAAYLRS